MGRPIKKTAYRQMFDGRKLNALINKCMSAYELVNLYNTFITTAEAERNARLLNNSDINKQLDKFIAKAKEDINADTNIMDIVQLKELIAKATVKQAELERQGRGGIQASKTRKANKEKRVYSDWIELDYSPFSYNYMYEYKLGKQVRSKSYERWRNNFPVDDVPTLWEMFTKYGIRVQRKIALDIEVITVEGMDIDNCIKSFQDTLVEKCWGLSNDYNIVAINIKRIGVADGYENCLIRFRVKQVD